MKTPAIDKERLAATLTRLCEIDSPSRSEARMAAALREIFTGLEADWIYEDDSATSTGSDTGNLIVRFAGNDPSRKPLFFCCHMDTVEPGVGVRVCRDGDRLKSCGDTILGGDDKSGIAALIEMMTILLEGEAGYGPIELIFTTCEEIGLLGAKYLDTGRLQARFGYALDTTGIDRVVIGAPAANRFKFNIHGIAAHAGLNPEQGISAFQIAAKAIDGLQLGRLDDQSTANIGLMNGGVATNIIPPSVALEGEVRSHSAERLSSHTNAIVAAFQKTVADWPVPAGVAGSRPQFDFEILPEYPAMALGENDPVVARVRKAGAAVGRTLDFLIAGGGSDANILCNTGLPAAIVATGMNGVHSTEEYLDLHDVIGCIELLYAVVITDD